MCPTQYFIASLIPSCPLFHTARVMQNCVHIFVTVTVWTQFPFVVFPLWQDRIEEQVAGACYVLGEFYQIHTIFMAV